MVTVLGQPFGWLAVTVFGAAYALAALLGVTLLWRLTQVPVLGGILAFTGVILDTGALFILLKEALVRASVDVGQ